MEKRSLEEYRKAHSHTVLNLGCGKTNSPEWFGLDITDNPGVDLVADCEKGIPLPSNSFDMIYARDFLEHISMKNNAMIMEEIYRVLKPGGSFQFMVPSAVGSNPGAAFQDPTHISFWTQMKFRYFYDDSVNGSFRALYDYNCRFVPENIETYDNEWNMTYVRGSLLKLELSED